MQVMVPLRYENFMEELTFLVQSGEIPIARIDDAVERILRVKFAAELFEFPLTDRSLLDLVGCKVNGIQLIVSLRCLGYCWLILFEYFNIHPCQIRLNYFNIHIWPLISRLYVCYMLRQM